MLKPSSRIKSFTWATKPAPADYSGRLIRIDDVGINGSLWFSDGIKLSSPPFVQESSGMLMILPSSGSFGDNGALTLTTALPTTYSNGCYMYFPAGAIFAGSAAGLYYVVMSSTTVGTVYNHTYTGGHPVYHDSPTPFECTGPGAYTQTTVADITLLNSEIKGGVLGDEGIIRIRSVSTISNSANSKVWQIMFGTSVFGQGSATTSFACVTTVAIQNRKAAKQIYNAGTSTAVALAAWGGGSTTSAHGERTVNTAVDQLLKFTAKLNNAADYIILEGFTAEVLPS